MSTARLYPLTPRLPQASLLQKVPKWYRHGILDTPLEATVLASLAT